MGYDMTRHLRAVMGVQLLFASAVVRPGTEVPTVINPSLVPANQQAPTAPPAPVPSSKRDEGSGIGLAVGPGLTPGLRLTKLYLSGPAL